MSDIYGLHEQKWLIMRGSGKNIFNWTIFSLFKSTNGIS